MKDSTVEHGGQQCLITDVDEAKDPPHVWLRTRPKPKGPPNYKGSRPHNIDTF